MSVNGRMIPGAEIPHGIAAIHPSPPPPPPAPHRPRWIGASGLGGCVLPSWLVGHTRLLVDRY